MTPAFPTFPIRSFAPLSAALACVFLLGACALVMLNDHAQGLDFVEHGGKDQVARLLRTVNRTQSKTLLKRLARPDIDMDFRQFSLLKHPQQQRYDCSIASLLE